MTTDYDELCAAFEEFKTNKMAKRIMDYLNDRINVRYQELRQAEDMVAVARAQGATTELEHFIAAPKMLLDDMKPTED